MCLILSPLTYLSNSLLPSLPSLSPPTEFVPSAYEYIFISHLLKKPPPALPPLTANLLKRIAPPTSVPLLPCLLRPLQSVLGLLCLQHLFFQSHFLVTHCLAGDINAKVWLEWRTKLSGPWMTAMSLNVVVNASYLAWPVSGIGHSWQCPPPW